MPIVGKYFLKKWDFWSKSRTFLRKNKNYQVIRKTCDSAEKGGQSEEKEGQWKLKGRTVALKVGWLETIYGVDTLLHGTYMYIV